MIIDDYYYYIYIWLFQKNWSPPNIVFSGEAWFIAGLFCLSQSTHTQTEVSWGCDNLVGWLSPSRSHTACILTWNMTLISTGAWSKMMQKYEGLLSEEMLKELFSEFRTGPKGAGEILLVFIAPTSVPGVLYILSHINSLLASSYRWVNCALERMSDVLFICWQNTDLDQVRSLF